MISFLNSVERLLILCFTDLLIVFLCQSGGDTTSRLLLQACVARYLGIVSRKLRHQTRKGLAGPSCIPMQHAILENYRMYNNDFTNLLKVALLLFGY